MSLSTPWDCRQRPLEAARVVRQEGRPDSALLRASPVATAPLRATLSPRASPRISARVSPPPSRQHHDRRHTCPASSSPLRASRQLASSSPLRAARQATDQASVDMVYPARLLNSASGSLPPTTSASMWKDSGESPQPEKDLTDDSGPCFVPSSASYNAQSYSENQSREDKLWNELAGVMKAPMINAPKQSKTGVTLPVAMDKSSQESRASTALNGEFGSLEERVARIEKMMDERFSTIGAEVAETTVSLCTGMEQRCSQLVEALREDLQKEMMDTVGEQVGHFMVKFAPKGMTVPVAVPEAQPCGQDAESILRKTGDVDAMVSIIMERVVERVKEDECLHKVTAQYEQVKDALDELLTKIGTFDASVPAAGPAGSPGSVELFNMVKSTALDVRRLRSQRNRDYSETISRFEGLETSAGSDFQRSEADNRDKEGLDEAESDWVCDAPGFKNSIPETQRTSWPTLEEPQEEPQYSCGIAEDSLTRRAGKLLHAPLSPCLESPVDS